MPRSYGLERRADIITLLMQEISPEGRGIRWRLELPLLLGGLLVFVFVSLAGKGLRSGAFLIGDCPYYASAALSLWSDRDADLSNQLRGGLAVHQNQVALSRDGRIVPKHPILMPFLSAPFYPLFGVAGFLLFNVVILILLATVVWAIVRLFAGPGASIAATLLVFAATFLRTYVYNYSADLLSTLLVACGILLTLKHRPVLGGGFLGLSVMAKVTNVFVAATVLGFLFFRRPRVDVLKAASGLLPGLACWMLINLAMFGGPLVTGYDRTIVLSNGTPVLVSHKGFFDLPVLEGMRGQLFDPRAGLLTTSPILLLAIPGLFPFVKRHPWEAGLFIGISELLFLLFSTYRWWATSHYGNRFLMVPVVLAAVPIALTIELVARKIRAWRTLHTSCSALYTS